MIYLELFLTFFQIGLFTFGGGYAMLPLIQEEVAAKGWLTMDQIVNFVAVSESTPGPFAINMSTYVGIEVGGVFGAVCATLGVVLPSFMVILIVARIYEAFRKNRIVAGCMQGLKPAVVGLIGASVISMGQTVFFSAGLSFAAVNWFWFIVSAIILAGMLVLVFKKVHPILIVVISAALGIAAGLLEPLLTATT